MEESSKQRYQVDQRYFGDFPRDINEQVEYLRAAGIVVSREAEWRIRIEESTGKFLSIKAACLYIRNRIEGGDNPVHKNKYLLYLVRNLISVRGKEFPEGLSVGRLMNTIIEKTSRNVVIAPEASKSNIKVSDQVLRRIVLLMRTEVVLEAFWRKQNGDSELYNLLISKANEFITVRRGIEEAKSKSRRKAEKTLQLLEEFLQRRDIGEFYSCLQQGPILMNQFLPFELDVFKQFYQSRVNENSPCTRLTYYVLNRTLRRGVMSRKTINRFEKALRRVIGVRFVKVVYLSRNILIHGFPTQIPMKMLQNPEK
jgi:hypothetical protein